MLSCTRGNEGTKHGRLAHWLLAGAQGVARRAAWVQDLMYTTVIASFMGFTHPAAKLSRERPPDRLMSLGIWLPVAFQFVTCAVFQVSKV